MLEKRAIRKRAGTLIIESGEVYLQWKDNSESDPVQKGPATDHQTGHLEPMSGLFEVIYD